MIKDYTVLADSLAKDVTLNIVLLTTLSKDLSMQQESQANVNQLAFLDIDSK